MKFYVFLISLIFLLAVLQCTKGIDLGGLRSPIGLRGLADQRGLLGRGGHRGLGGLQRFEDQGLLAGRSEDHYGYDESRGSNGGLGSIISLLRRLGHLSRKIFHLLTRIFGRRRGALGGNRRF